MKVRTMPFVKSTFARTCWVTGLSISFIAVLWLLVSMSQIAGNIRGPIQSIEGIIKEVDERSTWTGTKSRQHHELRLTYEFEHDGHVYTSKSLYADGHDLMPTEFRSRYDLREGSKVTVFFPRSNPQTSFLFKVPGNDLALITYLVFFMSIGVIFLAHPTPRWKLVMNITIGYILLANICAYTPLLLAGADMTVVMSGGKWLGLLVVFVASPVVILLVMAAKIPHGTDEQDGHPLQ